MFFDEVDEKPSISYYYHFTLVTLPITDDTFLLEGTRVISLRGLPVTLISSNTFTDKGVVFGTPLTESCIAQIYQLIEYLTKSESSK